MSKEEVQNAEEQVRTYTWKSEEGKAFKQSKYQHCKVKCRAC